MEPPTMEQIEQMNAFKASGIGWSALGLEGRLLWNNASRLANLRISGYNLFTYWICKKDREAIATIEHQTGILLPGL